MIPISTLDIAIFPRHGDVPRRRCIMPSVAVIAWMPRNTHSRAECSRQSAPQNTAVSAARELGIVESIVYVNVTWLVTASR